MPNIFAYAMLLIWPVMALALFRSRPRASALIWTILAGYMLLPAKVLIDLPLLPPLDKTNSPVLSAFLLCLAGISATRSSRAAASADATATERPGWLPRSPLARILILAVLLGPLITTYFNPDPLIYGPTFLKGMSLYDGLSFAMISGVAILPLLLGRKYLSRPEDVRLLLTAMALTALVHTVPMLFEIRFSPQLHRWIYGFFPHQFGQSMRFGGFRPQVFMEHGLRLSLIFSMCLLAALTLGRIDDKRRMGNWRISSAWLAVMLVLSKSVGAIITSLAAAPFVLLASRRTQVTLAATVAVMVLLYPLVRAAGLVPTETLVAIAGAEKGESLEFRFENEDILLDKALLRPTFGWGGWARGRVYDPVWGWDLSTIDGEWIGIMGSLGFVGFVSRFGLLVLPTLLLFRQRDHPGLTLETSALALILMLNHIDMIPNSGLTPITWLIAGSLMGRAEALAASRTAAAPPITTTRRRPPDRGRPAPGRGRPVTDAVPSPATTSDPAPTDHGPVRADPVRTGPVRPGLGGFGVRIKPPEGPAPARRPSADALKPGPRRPH